MKFLLKMLAVSVVLLTAYQSQAQDIIHKKNGKVIEAKVVELGTSEIKYKMFSDPDGPIYVDEKENIDKIVFQDGRTEKYGTTRIDASEMFAGQKKSAIKIGFMGPLVGYTNIIYERNVRPGRSWEVKGVLVGLGRQLEDEAVGFIGTYAYKFYKKPTFYTSDMKRSHLLQGGYIKPEVFVGYTSFISDYDYYNNTNGEKTESFTGGFMVNLGKEWIFDDAFVLDLSFGIGYGAGESRRSIYVEPNTGFAGQANLSIGWMLK
ncbi:MAG: hypothetical protein IT270_01580 [Saprospiraceae bacterium]|nr:hypothetical protein [Saprospiraceae bacterium]